MMKMIEEIDKIYGNNKGLKVFRENIEINNNNLSPEDMEYIQENKIFKYIIKLILKLILKKEIKLRGFEDIIDFININLNSEYVKSCLNKNSIKRLEDKFEIIIFHLRESYKLEVRLNDLNKKNSFKNLLIKKLNSEVKKVEENKFNDINSKLDLINKNILNINSVTNSMNSKLSEDITTTDLKSIYLKNKDELMEWIYNGKKLKDKSLRTKKDHIKKINKIFSYEIRTVFDFNKLIDEKPELFYSRSNVSFRTFIDFCNDRNKLKNNIAMAILSKVEGKVKSNINNRVPSEEEMILSLNELKQYYLDKPYFYLIYQLFIESGGRWEGGIQKMLLSFDINRLKTIDEITIYDINYDLDEITGNIIPIKDKTKLTFFLFMRTKTFNELMKYKEEIFDKNFIRNYKKYISRVKNRNKLNNFIDYSLIRKFVRTRLVKSGVSSEFADFIESRTDGDGGKIGFKIYQSKDEAINEYRKYLKYLNDKF